MSSPFDGISSDQLAALMQHAATPEWQQRPQNSGPLANYPVPLPGGSTDPTNGMSDAELLAAGFGRGIANVGRQIGNVAGIESNADLAEANRLDAPLLRTGAGGLGNLAGETGILAPLTMGAEMPLAGTAVGARLLASQILRGITEGAATGALMAGPGNRAQGAGMGALTGGALPGAGAAGNRLINGVARTPEAQLLLNQGIPLTPGQMNPKGSANLIEQSADRVPLVGPLIDASRENAEQQFGRAVIQQGAAPGAKITPSHNINEMFDQAADSWDPIYQQVHGFPVAPVVVSGGARFPLSQILSAAARVPGLKPSQQSAINDWLQARLRALPTNPMSEDYIGKDSLRSAIRGQQRNLVRASNAGQVDAPLMLQAYERAENAVTSALDSQLPADASATLRNADQGYAQLKIIERAVASTKDQVAGLTPSKLSNAIAQSANQSAYARGQGGPLRDLASAGTRVFETTVPPTGVRTLAGLAAGAAGYASPHIALPIMGTAGAASLLGAATPLGRRLAAGQTAPQLVAQRALGSLTSSAPPWALPVGGVLARQALNRGVPQYLTASPPWMGGQQ